MSSTGNYTRRKKHTKKEAEPEDIKEEEKTEDIKEAKPEDIKEELSPMYKNNKPLRERTKGIHTSDKKEEEPTDNEEEEPTDNEEEETAPTDARNEVRKDNEEEGETRILKREQEEKIAEYINETLKRVIKGENVLEDMKSFMDFVRFIPQNMFDENIEYYATVLSNATINGVKLFDDINAAREFVNDIRKKRRSRKWLRPKAQKQIKQEIQKNLQISPMMLKNVKHRTNAINIYQY